MSALKASFLFCAFCAFSWLTFKRGARLRWQSQPRQHGGLTRLRGSRAEYNYGQVSAGMEIDFFRHDYSTGTTNSLLRTIFSWARAAVSIVRGSVRSFSTSDFNEWLT